MKLQKNFFAVEKWIVDRQIQVWNNIPTEMFYSSFIRSRYIYNKNMILSDSNAVIEGLSVQLIFFAICTAIFLEFREIAYLTRRIYKIQELWAVDGHF